MGYQKHKYALTLGDPRFMRKALAKNLAEEKRTKFQTQRLQKILFIRLRDIEKEKEDLKLFLAKIYKSTGYFPRLPLW